MGDARMTFKLGPTSLLRLQGLNPDLVKVVERAIQLSDIDFTVLEGLRTKERQAQLLKSGATTTMNSRHLTGHAVDLGALVDGKVRWDWPLYFKLAEAMRSAAIEFGVKITWGGVWDKTMDQYADPVDEHCDYVARKRAEFKKKKIKKEPFVDGPHFEITWG